jgi:Ca2+-binding RTX toxin-like protein
MRLPSYRTKRPGNRVTRQLRVEQLENRELLTVVLDLPRDPVSANEGEQLVFPISASGSGTLLYNLDQAPQGAKLESGVFRWTPPDGPATETVMVSVTDEDGTVTGSFSIAVANVAPDAGIQGPSAGVRGQPLSFQVIASDPSPVDAPILDVTVNWGDGTAAQVAPAPTGTSVGHVFGASGSYTVTVTAKDKDGGQGTATQTVSITAAAIQNDPLYGGSMLVVGGTVGNDKIVLNPSKGIKVLINGKTQGNFPLPNRLVVYGQAGNDDIQVTGSLRVPAWLYGGEGNDRLKGGNGNDFLFGGAGNDNLLGGQGNDLLVGDTGADRLVGEAGDDVLVAGSVNPVLTESQIKSIMDGWAKGAKSVDNANTLKASLGVVEDSDPDKLTGAAGVDCFFYQAGLDVATDLDIQAPTKPKKK